MRLAERGRVRIRFGIWRMIRIRTQDTGGENRLIRTERRGKKGIRIYVKRPH